jgi:hypothetical protein
MAPSLVAGHFLVIGFWLGVLASGSLLIFVCLLYWLFS